MEVKEGLVSQVRGVVKVEGGRDGVSTTHVATFLLGGMAATLSSDIPFHGVDGDRVVAVGKMNRNGVFSVARYQNLSNNVRAGVNAWGGLAFVLMYAAVAGFIGVGFASGSHPVYWVVALLLGVSAVVLVWGLLNFSEIQAADALLSRWLEARSTSTKVSPSTVQGADETRDLLPLLHNRLSKEGQDAPQFVGEYAGIESLPKQNYPPIYFWFDTEAAAIRLAFNTPLLERWCVEEAHTSGISVRPQDQSVQRAIATLMAAAKNSFMSSLLSPARNGQAA